MRMKQLITLTILLFLLVSCTKDENGSSGDPEQKLVFSSLIAEKDNIDSGESTNIFATASGYRLTYNWAATAGDILGTGSKVVYAASPCQIGKNKITCTVRDGNNASQSKEIFIVVK
jgi:hypothetical protein